MKTAASTSGLVLFAIVVLAAALGGLSQTALTSMLAAIDEEFAISVGLGQWLTTAYMLVVGVTVPVAGFFSKRVCAKHLVICALALFLLGSLVSLIANSFWIMLAGRILQAVSAGITMPFVMTISMTRFPPGRNATMMGVAGIALGFAPNIGPLLGGAFIALTGWRGFFVFMSLIVLALLIVSLVLLKKEPHPVTDATLDLPSVLSSTLGFGGLLFACSNAAYGTIDGVGVAAPLIIGVAALIVFVLRQRRIPHPLISMTPFRSSCFRISFVAQNLLFASFMGITLIVPLFVQALQGGSALDAGMVFVPVMIFALIFNPLSGYLVDKIGVRWVVAFASACLAVGAVGMVFMDEQTPFWWLLVFQAIRGIGVSSLISPLSSWGLSELPHELMMDASSFYTTTRQVSAALGTALMVLAIVLCAPASEHGVAMDPSSLAQAATMGSAALGYELAFGLSALFSLGVLVVCWLRVR